ncbi:MAG: hypothetical protein WBI82_16205 [Sphaerochaeta sp.]
MCDHQGICSSLTPADFPITATSLVSPIGSDTSSSRIRSINLKLLGQKGYANHLLIDTSLAAAMLGL